MEKTGTWAVYLEFNFKKFQNVYSFVDIIHDVSIVYETVYFETILLIILSFGLYIKEF